MVPFWCDSTARAGPMSGVLWCGWLVSLQWCAPLVSGSCVRSCCVAVLVVGVATLAGVKPMLRWLWRPAMCAMLPGQCGSLGAGAGGAAGGQSPCFGVVSVAPFWRERWHGRGPRFEGRVELGVG